MRKRTTTITTLAMAALLLTGCAGATGSAGSAGSSSSGPSAASSAPAESSAGGGDACEVINADQQKAVIFSSIIPEMNTAEEIQGRADVMDAVTDVPADLAADWEAWRALLDDAATGTESGDYGWFPVDDAVKESGARLFDWYTSTC